MASDFTIDRARLKLCLAHMVGQHRDAVSCLDNPEDVARLERVRRERGSVEDCGAAEGFYHGSDILKLGLAFSGKQVEMAECA